MDSAVLKAKGVAAKDLRIGVTEGFALQIGERASLVHRDGCRAHGIVADLPTESIESLYADDSLHDYVAETVTVREANGETINAVCYNLPTAKLSGTNRKYARSLLDLATRLGLPESYLEEIRAMT